MILSELDKARVGIINHNNTQENKLLIRFVINWPQIYVEFINLIDGEAQ
jgi:hypothetical protein